MNEVKFEIVRTDAGYHSRIKGGNGETVWVTESYVDSRDAENAIQFLVEHVGRVGMLAANLVDERAVRG